MWASVLATKSLRFALFSTLGVAYGIPVSHVIGQVSENTNQTEVVANLNDSDQTDSESDDLGKDLGDLDALLDADITQVATTEIVAPVFSESVSTVERQESTVGRTPAAIYVITNEMIRRSGARSIPDALRLAPGVQVAQIDANKWAISIRGNNQRFSNKLLVQIDGRSVYTPLFAGVFWDVQDVLMEDIDRIEVIRGPGASVWGSNAVNGVINILTKRSQDTTGIYAEAGAGNEREFASARIGGDFEHGSWRAYGKWFNRDGGRSDAFTPADEWEVGRLGFRSDLELTDDDSFTVQGDYYDGNAGQQQARATPTAPFFRVGPDNQQISGGNALARWTHRLDDDSDWSLQAYFDQNSRTTDSQGFREDRETVDVDFQSRFKMGEYHSVVWGMQYRNTRDEIDNAVGLEFLPDRRSINGYSIFVQDQMTLLDDLLYFTAGSKFSWNDLAPFQLQPTARLLYTPTNRRSVWASVSRAQRITSRASSDIYLTTFPGSVPVFPTFATVIGTPGLESETLTSFEVGTRAAPTDTFFWDIAAFYNDYNDLQGFRAGTPFVDPTIGQLRVPLYFNNGAVGESYGFELVSSWEASARWSLRSGYSLLFNNMDFLPGSLDTGGGVDPRNQFFCHSSWDVGNDWQFDLITRYTDTLAGTDVPSYFELDARASWIPSDSVEFVIAGRNLLDHAHPEFENDEYAGVLTTEAQRELYGQAIWRF